MHTVEMPGLIDTPAQRTIHLEFNGVYIELPGTLGDMVDGTVRMKGDADSLGTLIFRGLERDPQVRAAVFDGIEKYLFYHTGETLKHKKVVDRLAKMQRAKVLTVFRRLFRKMQ